MSHDLPEGVIDAEPAGGWQSDEVVEVTEDIESADVTQGLDPDLASDEQEEQS